MHELQTQKANFDKQQISFERDIYKREVEQLRQELARTNVENIPDNNFNNLMIPEWKQ